MKYLNFEDIDIVSIEDMIISKLVWAKESSSDLQMCDIKILLKCSVDKAYLEEWCDKMDVLNLYKNVQNEDRY